jgi:hypothetical protein
MRVSLNNQGYNIGIYQTATLMKQANVVANGTIKNATVKATTYQNIDGMKRDLNQFLIFYNFNRGAVLLS